MFTGHPQAIGSKNNVEFSCVYLGERVIKLPPFMALNAYVVRMMVKYILLDIRLDSCKKLLRRMIGYDDFRSAS